MPDVGLMIRLAVLLCAASAGKVHVLDRQFDDARLHADTRPGSTDADRLAHKIAFLIASGFRKQDSFVAMLCAGRYTVGWICIYMYIIVYSKSLRGCLQNIYWIDQPSV
jgi:heme O synthase-like polyprenyltransferase